MSSIGFGLQLISFSTRSKCPRLSGSDRSSTCCAELLGNKQESEESGSESDEDEEDDADAQAPDSM